MIKPKYPNPFLFGSEMYILFDHISKDSTNEIISFQPIHIHESGALQNSSLFTVNSKVIYFCESLFLSAVNTANQIILDYEDENAEQVNYTNDSVFSFITTRYTQNTTFKMLLINNIINLTNVDSYSFIGYILTLK